MLERTLRRPKGSYAAIPNADGKPLKYAWPARARPEQVPPGKAVDHVATVEKGEAPSEAEVMNFWKGLTPEERFRYSLAATRDRPYVPIR